jgi:hypothetical protein
MHGLLMGFPTVLISHGIDLSMKPCPRRGFIKLRHHHNLAGPCIKARRSRLCHACTATSWVWNFLNMTKYSSLLKSFGDSGLASSPSVGCLVCPLFLRARSGPLSRHLSTFISSYCPDSLSSLALTTFLQLFLAHRQLVFTKTYVLFSSSYPALDLRSCS